MGPTSAVYGSNVRVYVFAGRFEDQLPELAVPCTGPQRIAIPLFEPPDNGFDDRPAMVDRVVLSGVVRPI
jgi:hypothetical protein